MPSLHSCALRHEFQRTLASAQIKYMDVHIHMHLPKKKTDAHEHMHIYTKKGLKHTRTWCLQKKRPECLCTHPFSQRKDMTSQVKIHPHKEKTFFPRAPFIGEWT